MKSGNDSTLAPSQLSEEDFPQKGSIDEKLKFFLKFSVLAPSGHNTQPWKFSIHNNTLKIYPDYFRRLPVVDPDDHALFISLGCALENLVITASHFGYSPKLDYFPPDEESDCLRAEFRESYVKTDPDLFDAIQVRQATRNNYNSEKIPNKDLQKLEQISRQENVQLKIFTDVKEIEPLIEFVKEGNIRQFNNSDFVKELSAWVRFNKNDAEKFKDGINSASMGMPSVPRWLGKLILRKFAKPENEAKKCEKQIRGSSGLLLFVAKSNEKTSWVDVGRSFERVALKATSLNIKHAHMNMPCEEFEVREKLKQHLGMEDRYPLLLLRIGYSQPMPRSFRRPIEDVLT